MHTFDLNMDEITKIEGAASLSVRVKDDKVEEVHFKTTEYKRFFTKAMEGKPIETLPQLLSRICGTCSNAHIICSIEACERALGIKPSEQTMVLRLLTMYGLIIRDHALHLYLFTLPDIFKKEAFLDFDDTDPVQHQLLHDGFEVKAAGNFLATLVAGRSVHGMYPTIGGFAHFPDKTGINEAIKKLEAIKPAVLRLINIMQAVPWHFDRHTDFIALIPERFGFINGMIMTSDGEIIKEGQFRPHLERVVLPYSQASAYEHEHHSYMVGALARLNLAKELLHPHTKTTLGKTLDLFPSTDIFRNNLAQAIEILHAIDDAIELLRSRTFSAEPLVSIPPSREAIGVGVIEAPRGTLYHKVHVGADGKVIDGEIVVPTGQNQINIEEDVYRLVEQLLPKKTKEEIVFELEKLIRAYDPCMSCASHFLKIDWH